MAGPRRSTFSSPTSCSQAPFRTERRSRCCAGWVSRCLSFRRPRRWAIFPGGCAPWARPSDARPPPTPRPGLSRGPLQRAGASDAVAPRSTGPAAITGAAARLRAMSCARRGSRPSPTRWDAITGAFCRSNSWCSPRLTSSSRPARRRRPHAPMHSSPTRHSTTPPRAARSPIATGSAERRRCWARSRVSRGDRDDPRRPFGPRSGAVFRLAPRRPGGHFAGPGPAGARRGRRRPPAHRDARDPPAPGASGARRRRVAGARGGSDAGLPAQPARRTGPHRRFGLRRPRRGARDPDRAGGGLRPRPAARRPRRGRRGRGASFPAGRSRGRHADADSRRHRRVRLRRRLHLARAEPLAEPLRGLGNRLLASRLARRPVDDPCLDRRTLHGGGLGAHRADRPGARGVDPRRGRRPYPRHRHSPAASSRRLRYGGLGRGRNGGGGCHRFRRPRRAAPPARRRRRLARAAPARLGPRRGRDDPRRRCRGAPRPSRARPEARRGHRPCRRAALSAPHMADAEDRTVTLLALENLDVALGNRPVLSGVTLTIGPGEVVGLVGPNGAGKTTLMRAALGLIPARGRSSLAELPPADRAKTAAFLPQAREIAWPMSVERVVALGRLPHLPPGARPGGADAEAVDRALNAMGLAEARDRVATRLSGGEQARVRPHRAPRCRAPRRRRSARDGPGAGQPPRGVRDRGAARRHRRGSGSACAGPRLVKPGPDILAAFGLALCAHAALGLVLAAPDGRAGAEGEQARAVAALAPAEATALMAAWSTPPTVGMAATAPPRPATSGESSPSRPAVGSDGPPRHTAAALPVPG